MSSSRATRAVLLALALAIPSVATAVPAPVEAQVVQPRGRGGRRGGTVVVTPGSHGGGAVVVDPGRPGGAVVVDPTPGRPGGAVVVSPGRPGGAVVVDPTPGRPGGGVVVSPGRPGGAVVVDPTPGRPGVVIVGPRGVVSAPPSRVVVAGPPPAPRVATRWVAPTRHGEIWVEPYWGWTGSSWEWIEGHWELPPQQGAIWVSPRWDGSGWVPGYWTSPAVTIPAQLGQPYQIGAQVAGTFGPQDPRDGSGAAYHDYVVALGAGQTVSVMLVGGPNQQYAGQRIDVSLQVLANGMVVATGSSSTGADSQITFTAQRPGNYVLRATSRAGAFSYGTYLIQSAQGQWAPQQSPYDQYWGGGYAGGGGGYAGGGGGYAGGGGGYAGGGGGYAGGYVQAQPAVPDCRSILLQMGHPSTSLMFCDGAEPYCAEALLRAGHNPTNLMFCNGVQPQCAVSMMQSGRQPTELSYCR